MVAARPRSGSSISPGNPSGICRRPTASCAISWNDREDLIYERSRNLPGWADGNPHTYFRAAERYERVNGVAFEEWKVTLPQELLHRQNLALTRDLVDAIAGARLPITYAFHDPSTLDGQRQQPHLHLLISARQNDRHARTAATHFTRYNWDHPERGGAQKDDAFRHKGAIKAHRVLLSDVINVHLEYAGLAARVHPGWLDARGLGSQLGAETPPQREPGLPRAGEGASPYAGGPGPPAGPGLPPV